MPSVPILQFLALLALHWLGDFVLQSDYMGMNKSKYNSVLLFHVMVYTCILTLGAYVIFYPNIKYIFIYGLVNGVLHFLVDYCTSRATAKLYQAGRRHYFFVVIGLDQLIHQVCLALTLPLLAF